LAILVLQVQDVLHRPVEMIRDERYLLEQVLEGVAYASPKPSPST
jgi:hypothetical protein